MPGRLISIRKIDKESAARIFAQKSFMLKNSQKIILVLFFCLFALATNLNFSPEKKEGIVSGNVLTAQASSSSLVLTLLQVLLVCGDGSVDPIYEFCDPGNAVKHIPPSTGTTTCQDFINPNDGLPWENGILTCSSDCQAFSTSTCYTCGDLHKQDPEECDGVDFGGGSSCVDFGYTSGNLHCTPDCRLDLSDCVVVGTEEPKPGSTPTTGGGGGGSSNRSSGFIPGMKVPPNKTTVIVNGKAYPNSEVRVLIDSTVVGIVKADSKGSFRFETSDVTPGVTTFGLWTDDERGLKSTLLTLTFRVSSESVTTINNVYLSPTIDVDKNQVNIGDDIKIFGKSSPEVNISIHVNSLQERVATTTSNPVGNWDLIFNTKGLEEDFHTAKAIIRLISQEGVIESNYSRSVSFYVGKNIPEKGKCGMADLNCDGSVNLVDFSILLFNWGTADATADISKDGKVGLPDFSIMMFYWTG